MSYHGLGDRIFWSPSTILHKDPMQTFNLSLKFNELNWKPWQIWLWTVYTACTHTPQIRNCTHSWLPGWMPADFNYVTQAAYCASLNSVQIHCVISPTAPLSVISFAAALKSPFLIIILPGSFCIFKIDRKQAPQTAGGRCCPIKRRPVCS